MSFFFFLLVFFHSICDGNAEKYLKQKKIVKHFLIYKALE